MNISDLELFLIELPASGAAVVSLVFRVASDTGLEGWGETRLAWRAAELSERRKAILSVIAGREVFDVEAILALDAFADRAVACGLEMALWDLIGRAARQPLCHLLGGEYRPSVPLSVRLPVGGPDSVAHWARAFLAQGIRSQVVSSTGSLEADLKLIATVREACGERVQLRFDGRAKYDLAGAAQLCARLERDSVQFVLDPLADGRAENLAYLRRAGQVALAAFETITRPADVMPLVRADAVSFVMVDPVSVGGLLRARQTAAVVEAAGLHACLRIEGTSGLALAATLQLAAATPSFISGHECSYPKLHDDILADALRVSDGMLAVPSGPGLGIEIDREKLECYQVSGS